MSEELAVYGSEQQGLDALSRAQAMTVATDDGYALAAEFSKSLKSLQKEIEGTFKPMKQRADAAKAEILGQERKHLKPVLEALFLVGNKMGEYHADQQRRQAEVQRQAQEAARKIAEDQALAQAEHLAKQGRKEAAEALLNKPLVVPTVTVASFVPKVSGISHRGTWSAQVEDFATLVKAVAEGKANLGLLEPNQPALNQLAVALKGNFNVPGVKAVKKTGMATRT